MPGRIHSPCFAQALISTSKLLEKMKKVNVVELQLWTHIYIPIHFLKLNITALFSLSSIDCFKERSARKGFGRGESLSQESPQTTPRQDSCMDTAEGAGGITPTLASPKKWGRLLSTESRSSSLGSFSAPVPCLSDSLEPYAVDASGSQDRGTDREVIHTLVLVFLYLISYLKNTLLTPLSYMCTYCDTGELPFTTLALLRSTTQSHHHLIMEEHPLPLENTAAFKSTRFSFLD